MCPEELLQVHVGDQYASKWALTQWALWKETLGELGLPLQAWAASTRAEGVKTTGERLKLEKWSVTTPGLLLLLLRWQRTFCKKQHAIPQQRAGAILKALVHGALKQQAGDFLLTMSGDLPPVHHCWPPDPSATQVLLSMKDLVLDLSPFFSLLTVPRLELARPVRPLTDALSLMWHLGGSGRNKQWRVVLWEMVVQISWDIEHSAWMAAASSDPLQAHLVYANSKRRVIPAHVKMEVAEAAGKGELGRSGPQVMRIVHRFAGKKRPRDDEDGPTEGDEGRWFLRRAGEYLKEGRASYGGGAMQVVSVATDATRLAGREFLATTVAFPEVLQAMWLPPQAPALDHTRVHTGLCCVFSRVRSRRPEAALGGCLGRGGLGKELAATSG